MAKMVYFMSGIFYHNQKKKKYKNTKNKKNTPHLVKERQHVVQPQKTHSTESHGPLINQL